MKNYIGSKNSGVLIAVVILLAGVGLVGWQLPAWKIAVEPNTSPEAETEAAKSQTNQADLPQTQIPESSAPPVSTAQVNTSKPTVKVTTKGSLRVSNQTQYPVRLALRARSTETRSYQTPAHWDFAPEEGGVQGLTLSLPEGNVKLKKGDILVAFAQDGSRRYWGPFVVGETSMPAWNKKTAEWQLILQP